MYCPKCGKENADESLFCTACGGKLNGESSNEEKTNEEKTSAADASVGEVFVKIKDGAAHTGAYIKENAGPLLKKTTEYTKEKAKKNSKLSFKKVAITVVIFVFVIFLLIPLFRISDEQKIQMLANNFAESINDNDIKDLVKCLDPAIQEKTSAQLNNRAEFFGFVDLKDMFNISGDNELSIEVSNIVVTDDTATAKFIYHVDGGGKKSSENVDLVKVKGKWYLEEM